MGKGPRAASNSLGSLSTLSQVIAEFVKIVSHMRKRMGKTDRKDMGREHELFFKDNRLPMIDFNSRERK